MAMRRSVKNPRVRPRRVKTRKTLAKKVAVVAKKVRILKKAEDKKWKDIATSQLITNVYVPSASAAANSYRYKITDIS